MSILNFFITKVYTYNLKKTLDYKFVFYSAESPRGLSHLDLWIPIFIKSNISFVVFLKSYRLFKDAIIKYPEVSFVVVSNRKKVNFFLNKIKNVKVIFYSSNIGYNIEVVDNTNLKHIFIGHGDSDKTASAHKFFRIYDEIWVAGEAHIDRFKSLNIHLNGLKFKKIGRPNLEIPLKECLKKYNKFMNRKVLNILYLSTWEGAFAEQNYTSIYILKDILRKFSSQESIDSFHIKLHPFLGKRDKELAVYLRGLSNLTLTSFNIEIINSYSVEELLLKYNYNVFICDISAVITEVLICNKPIFVYIPKNKKIKILNSKMEYKDYTYTFSNIEELLNKINEVILKGNDYLKYKRLEALEYIVGKSEILNRTFYKSLEDYVL